MNVVIKFLVSLLMLCIKPAVAGDAYVQTAAPGWDVRPIITVGESALNGYRMVGVPDGLGAFDNGDGSITVLMNHELNADIGTVRTHGSKGAFVSRWMVRLNDFKVLSGEDLTKKVQLWNIDTQSHYTAHTTTFGRFCSADLAHGSAFMDANGNGFSEKIFLNGEEEKDFGGRAFAHIASGEYSGVSYELPHLGRVAWENLLALPNAGKRTVVIGMDDFPGGHVYVYVGEKRRTGNPAEKAGLVGGALYTVKFEKERFTLLPLGDVVGIDGKVLRARASSLGATPLLRPEDGAWDKLDKNLFWFATTDKIDGHSQLFRMDFDDARAPEKGGRYSAVLTAIDIGGQMFDNIEADSVGRILLNEDPGKDKSAAGIWLFDPKFPNKATRIFDADAERFVDKNNAKFMTLDEEQSGIVEVTDAVKSASWFDVNKRYYLGVAQAHLAHLDTELVEYGQLYLISGSVKQ